MTVRIALLQQFHTAYGSSFDCARCDFRLVSLDIIAIATRLKDPSCRSGTTRTRGRRSDRSCTREQDICADSLRKDNVETGVKTRSTSCEVRREERGARVCEHSPPPNPLCRSSTVADASKGSSSVSTNQPLQCGRRSSSAVRHQITVRRRGSEMGFGDEILQQ